MSVDHEVEPIQLKAVRTVLDSRLLPGEKRLGDDRVEGLSDPLAGLSIIIERAFEKLLLRHHQVVFDVTDI